MSTVRKSGNILEWSSYSGAVVMICGAENSRRVFLTALGIRELLSNLTRLQVYKAVATDNTEAS